MRFRYIKYFLVLCDERNFTRAANHCGITQPSLTNAIKRLEDLFGGSLFDRTRKSNSLAKPTPLALVIKPYFERAHLAWDVAQRRANKRIKTKH